MDEHGRVKLCDFGFANLMQSDKPFEEFCGSPEYAAPGKYKIESLIIRNGWKENIFGSRG